MVQVGNESGSELVLSNLGKGFGREQVEATLSLLSAGGAAFHLLSCCWEGRERPRRRSRESVALLEKYQPRLVNLTVGIRIHPGLPLHRIALAEGVVAPEDNLLWPKFYLAPAVKDWIWELLGRSDRPAPQLDLLKTVFGFSFLVFGRKTANNPHFYLNLNFFISWS